MKFIKTLFRWYGKRNVLLFFGAIVVLGVAALFVSGEKEVVEPVSQLPIVAVSSVKALRTNNDLQLIGSVRSVNEASIDAETGGRVTAVRVRVGDSVSAGTVLAQLENASEYASLLQAEGAYESAQAAAAQSDITVAEAENAKQNALTSAVSAQQGAYTTVNSVLITTIDDVFRNLETYNVTFELNGGVMKDAIVTSRKTLRDDMASWSQEVARLQSKEDVIRTHEDSRLYTEKVKNLLDKIYERSLALSNVDRKTLAGADMDTYRNELTSARSQLDSVTQALSTAITQLNSADESFNRAIINSTSGSVSSANAQLKQALGSLKSAQANYEKTVLRTPISGVVHELTVQQGDYVSSFESVAKVVNEGAQVVTTYVGDSDRALLTVGNEVLIDGSITGTITTIAPSVDSKTKKTEVKIAIESNVLTNGDTVKILYAGETQEQTEVIIPLAAVKLSADDASIFRVVDGVIVASPVTLGDIRGSYVVIDSGLSLTDEIIVDVRGLASGQSVEIK